MTMTQAEAFGLAIDLVEFLFDNGPATEWPDWESTRGPSIPDLVDVCISSLKARVKHNIENTDWSSTPTGGPPDSPMRVLGEIDKYRAECVLFAVKIQEEERLDNMSLAYRMMSEVRRALISGTLSWEMRTGIPEGSWPMFTDLCAERGYYSVDADDLSP